MICRLFCSFVLAFFCLLPAAHAEEQKACLVVESTKGWQSLTIPAGYLDDYIDIAGYWTIDSQALPLTNADGHLAAEDLLKPHAHNKYHQKFIFGALLVNIGKKIGNFGFLSYNVDKWSEGYRKFPGETIRFRINDSDETLSNNDGRIRVCLFVD